MTINSARYPTVSTPDEVEGQQAGFFTLESGDLWQDDVSHLPETWLTSSGRSVQKAYALIDPVGFGSLPMAVSGQRVQSVQWLVSACPFCFACVAAPFTAAASLITASFRS